MKESIKALREKNNYSQATVAKYLNISRQMYIKYESGEAEPPVKVIVGLSKLYKVNYEQIIDDEILQKKSAAYEIHDTGALCVSSPSVAYGISSDYSGNSNFELAKTLIPRLSVFEQLQMLSLLATAIGKNGANQIAASEIKKPEIKLNNLNESEKDTLFKKFSGCLKDSKIDDSKDARLEHLYKKYGI